MSNRSRIFFSSCVALIATAMSFGVRADIKAADLDGDLDVGSPAIGHLAVEYRPGACGFDVG
jgi:hypothetical protein